MMTVEPVEGKAARMPALHGTAPKRAKLARRTYIGGSGMASAGAGRGGLMSWMIEKIEVSCPKCGESFEGWDRPSQEPAASSTCPTCGHVLARDASIREDGAWQPLTDEVEERGP
jgi:predicted RNA-binding Zn-ribbon protein involved in translation (DUF1610 family)